eukprot:TRINITY_DN391_c0_g1_i12.p1 TRINITY_DN391_c0_g1~~TRINITY_DN391_c0_g1_i12.p1  ORF type:complete len:212 (-),score=51.07 TRINITY_DN391_c0_g1_i12:162-797(-)
MCIRDRYQRRVHGDPRQKLSERIQNSPMQPTGHVLPLIAHQPVFDTRRFQDTSLLYALLEEERKTLTENNHIPIRLYIYFTCIIAIAGAVLQIKYADFNSTIYLSPVITYLVGLIILDFGLRRNDKGALNTAFWIVLISFLVIAIPLIIFMFLILLHGIKDIYAVTGLVVTGLVLAFGTFDTYIFTKAATDTVQKLKRNERLQQIYQGLFV